MSEEKIEVVYFDGDPIVYRNGSQLNEKEIVNLLVEYFEDCDILIKENESLKEENDYLLKVMFAIKEYAENEDYENIIKAINKVSERLG